MGRRLPRPTPETAQVVHQREAFLGALRGRSNVPIPVGRDANSLARSRAGGASASAVRAYQDEFVLAGGEEEVELTYLPLTYSEHTYLNGVYQREGDDYDWTRESGTRTVTVKAAMDARAGDMLIVEYLYYAGTPVIPGDGTPSNVTFVGFGTSAEGTSAVSPTLPAGVGDGDLLLLAVCVKTDVTPTGTSGWSLVASTPFAENGGSWLDTSKTLVYQRTYDSGSYTAPSLGGATLVSNIAAFENASIESSATWDSGTDTTPYSIDGVTTAGPGRRVFFAIGGGDDNSISSVANSNLTDIGSNQNYDTYGAGSIVLGWATGVAASAGDIGATTFSSLALSCTAVTVVLR